MGKTAMKTIWKANPDRQGVGTRPDWFTYLILSCICVQANGRSVTKKAVMKRAVREGWTKTGAKGTQHRFKFEDLPEDVQLAVLEYYGELPEEDITEETQTLNEATQKQRERVASLLAVIEAWKEWHKARKGSASKKALRGEFVELIRVSAEREETLLPGLHWKKCRDVMPISVRTLERQEGLLNRKGRAGLVRRQGGHNRGKFDIPAEQQIRIRGIMREEPDWGARRISTVYLKAEFGESAAKEDTVRRFMKSVMEEDPGYCAMCRSMDEYKSRYQPASGKRQIAQYPLHYLQLDSTMSDVVCSDGKRYFWIGGIDEFSRRVMYKLFPTSNRYGVLAVIAAVCGEWGIPRTSLWITDGIISRKSSRAR